MSKQPHDQDDNQTPSGDTPHQSPPSGTDDRSKPGTRSRSRRRGKAADGTSPPAGSDAKAAASTTASDKTETPAAKLDTPAVKSDTPTSKPQSNAGDKPKGADSKPVDSKPNNKPGKQAGDQPRTTSGAGIGGGATPPRDNGVNANGNGAGTGKYGLVALVLAVLLGIALLLAAWQGWQRLDAQQQRIAELEARSGESASRDDLSSLQGSFDDGARERDEAIAEVRDAFASHRSEIDGVLDQVLDELSSEQETDEREWLHAEAAYLLRLANQRLQLERDVEGAAALLRTADGRLRDADNPALTPVRREISSELAALDAVPRIDRTGLYLALDAQQEQLARLPLNQDIEQIAAESGIEQPPSGTWQQQLSRFGAELRSLVTVRRHEEALEALIAPDQEIYLRQNVRLLVEQAQLALLKEEQELYVASLDKALGLIEAFYATDRDSVQRALERLTELREASIRPELPDISASQQALAEFIERRFNGGASGSGSNEGNEGDAT